MFYTERHNAILKILEERKTATIHYLSENLYVSEPTIRRDLKILADAGLIKRTFGGAILAKILNSEVPLVLRERENPHMKDIIAKKAIDHISDGQVIFLDASSTVYYITKYLSGFTDLTIITNNPKIPLTLAEQKIRVFCTGGLMLENSIAYVGSHTNEFLQKFNADLTFFSCRGLSETGLLSDSSVEESDVRRVMIKQSQKNVFLCTSDKVGKKYMYTLCKADDIDCIISDIDIAFIHNADKADIS